MTTPPSFFDQLTVTQWISLLQVGATVFVGIVAGGITWVMQSRQIDIAKGLKAIALGQHETAATKLRLELFEKRFKYYEEMIACLDEATDYEAPLDAQKIRQMDKKFDDACAPLSFLFSEQFHYYATNEIKEIIISYIKAVNKSYGHSTSEIQLLSIDEDYWFSELQRVYQKLNEMAIPFLQVEKEKPLIEQDDQS